MSRSSSNSITTAAVPGTIRQTAVRQPAFEAEVPGHQLAEFYVVIY
jgi:hypothetical protein